MTLGTPPRGRTHHVRHSYNLSPNSHAPKLTVVIATGLVEHEVVMDRHPRRDNTFHVQRAVRMLESDGYPRSGMQLVEVRW